MNVFRFPLNEFFLVFKLQANEYFGKKRRYPWGKPFQSKVS